jgi:peptidyl-prolyl cis-trans isomerase C
MQNKLRNCIFTIIISLLAISWGFMAQAEESAAPKNSTAPAGQTTAAKAAAPASTATAKSGTAVQGKAATVNGTAISQDQFDNALSYQKEIASLQGMSITDEQMAELKYDLLQSLIGTELLYQESQKSGIKVEEKEIDETFQSNKQKANFKTDAEFEEALKKSKKSTASYRAEIKQGLAIDHFVKSKFTEKTSVSDAEAKKYYSDNPSYFQQPAQVRISHIMIGVASSADQTKKDEAKKKIEQVLKRLKAGEDFAAVAKETSEDANSKNNGGDLNFFSKGQLPQAIETAAFALKTGEISDVVNSDSGYHILKVTDKKDSTKIGYEEVKNDIISSLKNSKVSSAVNKYITVLKNKSTIMTYPVK